MFNAKIKKKFVTGTNDITQQKMKTKFCLIVLYITEVIFMYYI